MTQLSYSKFPFKINRSQNEDGKFVQGEKVHMLHLKASETLQVAPQLSFPSIHLDN